MMKKIFFLILILVSIKSLAQFPQVQSLGAPKTEVYSKGGLGTDSGFIYRTNFADTATANLGFLDAIPGITIRVGSDLYIRNQTATSWIKINGIDDVYVISGINTDTLYKYKNNTQTLVKIFDRKEGIIVPGVVTWDSGLTFSVSPSIYYIDGVRYTSAQTSITLDAADGTNPRIDALALDATGVIKITGTAAASPAFPQITPDQILLTYIQVNAGATTPTSVSSTTIYDENTEWTASATGVTVNFNNTSNVFHLTKAADVGAFTNGQSFKFVNGSTLSSTDFTAIKFYIRLKATFTNSTQLQLAWLNGNSVVSSTVNLANNTYGYSRQTTGSYQEITIPISAWSFSSSTFNTLRVTLAGSNASGFYFDYAQIQGGITQPTATEVDPTVNSIIKNIPVTTDATTNKYYYWNNGSIARKQITYSDISGTPSLNGYELLSNKATDLTSPDNTKYPTTLALSNALAGYVPTSRTLTINGTTYDLSENRSWTITPPGIDDVLAVGQSLTTNRTITAGANYLQVDATGSTGFYSTNTTGTAIRGQTSSTGTAVAAYSLGGGLPMYAYQQDASTNTVRPLLSLNRVTSGTAANGIGSSINFNTEINNGGLQTDVNTIISKLTNASSGSLVSELSITGLNGGSSETFANFQTGGIVRVNNNADTLATRAYARSVGGGGGSGTVNTGAANTLTYYPSTGTTVDDATGLTWNGSQMAISSATARMLKLDASSGDSYLQFNTTTNTITVGTEATGLRFLVYDDDAAVYRLKITGDGLNTFENNSSQQSLVKFKGSAREIGFGLDGSSLFSIYDYTNSVYDMAFTAGGEVIFGGSTSDAGDYKIQNNGNLLNTGYITIIEQAAPSTPAAGYGVLYPKTDGKLYWKDDAGTEYDLTGGGSSGITVGTTTITSGTNGRVLYDNSGVVGEIEKATASTASTLVQRDANANITTNNWLGGYTTTATAAGTTTLTVSSSYLQYFTGSTTQTVQLPDVSTLTLGHQFVIVNNSTGNVTVNSSGGNAVVVLAGSTNTVVTCIATSGTGAGSWSQSYSGVNVASGKKVTQNNSITYAGTDGTTMTFPSTSATIARTDAAQTFTGVQTFSSAPVISSITNTGTLTLPTVTSTITAYKEAAISSNAIWSPSGDGRDNFYDVTAQAAAVTTIDNPSGSAANHNTLTIRVKDNGTARALTWSGTQWRASTNLALPTTTTLGKTMYIKFIYNSTDTKWDLVSVLDGF